MVRVIGILMAAAVCWWSAAAYADEHDLPIRRVRLKLDHELERVFTIDLNGDGLRDLVAVVVDKLTRDPISHLRVFIQSATGFTEKVSARMRLPDHLALAGAGRFSMGPGVALLMPDRLEVWPWAGDRFIQDQVVPLSMDSVFPTAPGVIKGGVPWVVDVDDDGINELLVPRFDGFTLVRSEGSRTLVRHAELSVRTRGWVINYFKRRYVAYDLPAFRLLDVNGRGWKDLVVYNDGLVQVFYLDGRPDDTRRLPDIEHDLQPPGVFDPKAPRDPPLLLIAARDLNRDGILDLICSKNSTTTSELNTTTRILIFYGYREGPEEPLRFRDAPDQVYAMEGFTLPVVKDINADGGVDLVLVNVEITFWNSIKALIARSVTADAAFYLMPPSGRFVREPNELVSYSIKFSLGRYNHQPLAVFGDLNGDGLPDLLLSVDKNRLGIHWGRKDGYWDDDYDVAIRDFLPIRVKRVLVEDLNGDRRDDLIFIYNRDDIRQMPEMANTFTVIISQFGDPDSEAAVQRRKQQKQRLLDEWNR